LLAWSAETRPYRCFRPAHRLHCTNTSLASELRARCSCRDTEPARWRIGGRSCLECQDCLQRVWTNQ
jgi:hypothetical protein